MRVPSRDARRTFETLFGVQVDLLRLCDFLQQFLDDGSVIVAYFTKTYLRQHFSALTGEIDNVRTLE
jgi:hypothetical protein